MKDVNINTIEKAYTKIKNTIVETPLVSNKSINNRYKSSVFFKLESLQLTGSFKIRGALNKLLELTDHQRKSGVVAYSSGNHAQAVSYASRLMGIESTIVMPNDAPAIKLKNTRKYGAKIVLYDRMNESREDIASKIAFDNNKTIIRPFDDEDIISGQGTAGLEITKKLLKDKITPDIFLCCCSGGGLIAGTSVYLKNFYNNLSIYCAEPEHYDDMRLSLNEGKLVTINPKKKTICDSLTCKVAGQKTFRINKKLLSGGFVVSDDEVKEAIRFLYKEFNIIVEPGGAVPTAAFIKNQNKFIGKVVLVMVSGGNIDKKLLNSIINNE
ncbi:MAG: L-threonine dehydratase catabolic TdcB [Alphaproteobacteria bacterium MarineAlpha5_Bin11]|nr:pyridoxal-5'-phosphate-dependent protein [Pelagibacteraceae bacterium]PPR44067.1 MAG: L-threonine dehydratase catabolic TdcB [Alphaproteobacteria bacterium MarineAlpha5_Bin11]PPR50121.1 MAG: L-threonine dehydratase catabolic TdcB [Alphaproteobacteria bacterium MarineAlpha5_Bin10]|tara:strand:+ start:5709 stop:6686 length:978 start_codon:yes stop_codon:yes gene_type:complete